MATTLQTGDFSLRALPTVPRVNPADFDARIGELLGIVDQGMQLPARLEGVRSAQRRGRLERATEPQALELAQRQAQANLDLLPYEVAAKREGAIRSLDEPAGTFLSYDPAGNLVRSKAVVRTNPVTGETETLVVPEDLKTAEQVAAERESTAALAQMRLGNVAAAKERAAAATTSAEASKIRALNVGGARGRSVTRELKNDFGEPVGVVTFQFDGTGNMVRQYLTTPDGKTVEMPVPGEQEASPDEATPPDEPALQSTAPIPNERQLQLLRRNPALAPQFDEMFGPGAAARVLGGG